MLDVYAFSTPNSVKVPIALEELALDHTLLPVNICAGGQKTPEFNTLNPNAKVPVLVERLRAARAADNAVATFAAEDSKRFGNRQ
jgi:glutathione S-transferase